MVESSDTAGCLLVLHLYLRFGSLNANSLICGLHCVPWVWQPRLVGLFFVFSGPYVCGCSGLDQLGCTVVEFCVLRAWPQGQGVYWWLNSEYHQDSWQHMHVQLVGWQMLDLISLV
jgi:hypothetical protein